MDNPFRWDLDDPQYVVARPSFVGDIATLLRGGRAVKLIGGRGMGKSVLLRQIAACFEGESDTRAIRVSGPPEDPTLAGGVAALARHLKLAPPPNSSLDALMETLEATGIRRLVVLLDEIDQYVLQDGTGNFARTWLNRLETLRRAWPDRFAVLVAGGVGLLHVSHVLGSGLVSRAEERIMRPFSQDELRALCNPLTDRGVAVEGVAFELLRTLSGANPALATYGLGHIWSNGAASPEWLANVYAQFKDRHSDFIKDVRNGVSRHGMVGAPGRVLDLLSTRAGVIAQAELRDACAGDEPPVDVSQALKVLMAAGLIHVEGLTSSDRVDVSLVSSVLNLPVNIPDEGEPVERLIATVAAALGQMHRVGRDFHGDKDLLPEKVFSSMLAVALYVAGWPMPVREPIQAAGYADIVVPLQGMTGHVVIEVKLWPRNDCAEIQKQVDDYRVDDTVHGIAVTFGTLQQLDWAKKYESKCLQGQPFTVMPRPPDVAGHWRVESPDDNGKIRRTDHFIVQILKRP